MNTEGTYIRFKEWPTTGKTRRWLIVNKKQGDGLPLGEVRWYGPWRLYVAEFSEDAVFSDTCLREIADFCTEATKEQRQAVREARA